MPSVYNTDQREEPMMHRLGQFLDWVDQKLQPWIDTPVVIASEPGKGDCPSPVAAKRSSTRMANLGVIGCLRLTIRAKPLVLTDKKRGAVTTTPASTPENVAAALNAIKAPGKALHIVFVSAPSGDDGARWNRECLDAEIAIAELVRDWPGGKVDVAVAEVQQAGWKRASSSQEGRHPFRDSEPFGTIKLPLLIEWASGRAAERLRAPANGNTEEVRAYFERTCARAAAEAAVAEAGAALETTGVRLEARLPSEDALPADAAAPGFLTEVRGGLEVDD